VGYRREEAIEELKNVRALMAGEYTLRPWDDLGGWYDYSVKFENGAELGLKVYAAWPECPDWDVTEDEIFSLIKLDRIYEIPLPTATVSP
jgi:hypothetical protein